MPRRSATNSDVHVNRRPNDVRVPDDVLHSTFFAPSPHSEVATTTNPTQALTSKVPLPGPRILSDYAGACLGRARLLSTAQQVRHKSGANASHFAHAARRVVSQMTRFEARRRTANGRTEGEEVSQNFEGGGAATNNTLTRKQRVLGGSTFALEVLSFDVVTSSVSPTDWHMAHPLRGARTAQSHIDI